MLVMLLYFFFFLSVSVNTSHWEICHCHLSTVYHCLLIKTNKKKMGANPAATVCSYRGDVTAGVTVCGWDYLRSVSVTLTALRGYSVCVCVCVGLGGGRCSECVQESHWRFLLIFAAATFFVATFSMLYTDGGCRGIVLNLAEFKVLGLTHPLPRKTEPPESQINK